MPDHVGLNRAYWDDMAEDWVRPGERSWAAQTPFWGIWELPETELQLLPANMHGLDAIELGCGTGYVSAWMTRRGATVVGIDNSAEQLRTAHRLMDEHNLKITFIHGNAEEVPYPDESFDFAISEYGAAIWCDPYRWIPEAYRLLKPGGYLTFLGHHPFAIVCTPLDGDFCEERLHHAYFGLHQQDWSHASTNPGGIEFNLPISEWMALFRKTGFDVLNYHELRAPATADDDKFGVAAAWAKRWPAEQVWHLRKPA